MFVTFEGPEGGGKSTALRSVARALQEKGHPVTTTREPGAGPLGQQIRELLLHGQDLTPETELFLFLADRANHVATIIKPALATNHIVLCDRFTDSTLVYQGIARGLDQDLINEANHFATKGLVPDLTLLFDLPPEIGLSRLRDPDRIDKMPLKFHQQVRNGFLELAKTNPRWVILDATKTPQEIAQDALQAIDKRLSKRPNPS
jgi:dTMP kinase